MPGLLCAGDLYGRCSRVVGESCCGGEAAGSAGPTDQPAGHDAHADDFGEGTARGSHESGDGVGVRLQLGVESADLGDEVLAIALRACSTAPWGRIVRSRAAAVVADRSRGAPPAMRARRRAWSWLTARTLDCAKLTRRSSSTAMASA
jgi:hypothetical protein